MCSLQQMDDQVEMAKMITALTTVLIQPPETGGPEPGPGSEPVELSKVKEEDRRVEEVVECSVRL